MHIDRNSGLIGAGKTVPMTTDLTDPERFIRSANVVSTPYVVVRPFDTARLIKRDVCVSLLTSFFISLMKQSKNEVDKIRRGEYEIHLPK